jgi:outer membrane protein OmpA-like peptidoglycan-associated protein
MRNALRSAVFSGIVFLLSVGLGFAQDQQPTVTTSTGASQDVTPMAKTPVYRAQVVGRTTRALNYRHRDTTNIEFQGTKLDPNGKGKAKVQSRTGRLRVEVELENLPKPSIYGPEYLTYVLWAITPEGRASNLGEIVPKDGKAELSVTTDLQAFGLILTAEPYFAVTIPSDQVILENLIKSGTKGWEQPIETKFDVLQRGEYTVDVNASDLASQTADEKMPIDLKEAINAVAIAKAGGAQKYAADSLAKAEDFLARAQDYYQRKQGDKAIGTVARGAVQSAEDARLLTIRRKQEEERIEQQRRTEVAEQQRQAAEQQRQAAEQQREAAIQLQQQAQTDRAQAEEARRQAEQAQKEAEQARADALAQKQAAQAESDKARQDAQRAEQDKEQTRARLMQQLNQVLETRESARGLIVSMPDVLFDFNKYTLKTEARERLAKVSGILMAYPGLNVKVEGHTDNIGSQEYNQKLSDERAETVRGFMVSQGVSPDIITAQGFGKTQPVASNDSAAGRSKNRRVELVVNGSAIGDQGAAGAGVGSGPGPDTTTPPGTMPAQPTDAVPATPPPTGTNPPQR